jgi:hypothetical protein
MKKLQVLVLLIAGLVLIPPVYGGMLIEAGNNPQPDENILFNSPGLISTGNPVEGITNQSGLIVLFEGLEDLTTPSGGQARVEAVDGAFTTYTFSVQNGTFLSYIFNLSTLNNASGSATITAVDHLGASLVGTFSISGGQNFFTVYAVDDQQLMSVNVVSTVPLENVGQNRVGGAVGEIPEPGTYALVAAGIGALVYIRRRKIT